jgi:hypothetical protein
MVKQNTMAGSTGRTKLLTSRLPGNRVKKKELGPRIPFKGILTVISSK